MAVALICTRFPLNSNRNGPQPHAQQQQQGAPAQEHHHRTLSHPSHPYEQPSQQERRIQALKAEQERLEEEIEKLKYDLEHERDEDITHAQPTEKPAGRLVLGLDVGTTGAKAFIYDERANCIADSYKELTPIRDEPGQEEQCPQELWDTVIHLIKKTMGKAGVQASDICAMGVTTQRNTLILWDKETGEPLCNFVTWQDTRTAKYCRQLNDALACRGIRSAATVAYRMTHKVKYALAKNYHFQPTHITPRLAWMLQRLPNDKKQYIKQGRLLFGLVDSYLIWKFTGGAVHATDYSNISSTGLWDVFVMNWNTTITNMCRIPLSIMPEIRPSSGDFGETVPDIFGASIPIRANCADQGAALFGECCFSVGDAKVTAGTGCFLDVNTGTVPIGSPDGLYPFVAWTIGDKTTFMMEGLASTIGTVVNWSRNHLGIFDEEEETSAIASSVPSTEGVYFVPAFSGLGAPQSDGGARGVIVGLSATTTKAHIVRAMLEGIAYSISDLMELAEAVAILPEQPVRINGGLVQNDFLCQFLADILDKPLNRPRNPSRATAAGIVFLAGLAAGVWSGTDELEGLRKSECVFMPSMDPDTRMAMIRGWKCATIRSLSSSKLRKMKAALRRQEKARKEKKAFEMNAVMHDIVDTFKLAATLGEEAFTKHDAQGGHTTTNGGAHYARHPGPPSTAAEPKPSADHLPTTEPSGLARHHRADSAQPVPHECM